MKLKITVHGVAYEVDVEILDAGEGFAPASALPPVAANPGADAVERTRPVGPPPRPRRQQGGDSISVVRAPIAGTVIEVKCKAGDDVSEGDVLMIIEAMKMNTSIAAPRAGKIKGVRSPPAMPCVRARTS